MYSIYILAIILYVFFMELTTFGPSAGTFAHPVSQPQSLATKLLVDDGCGGPARNKKTSVGPWMVYWGLCI